MQLTSQWRRSRLELEAHVDRQKALFGQQALFAQQGEQACFATATSYPGRTARTGP